VKSLSPLKRLLSPGLAFPASASSNVSSLKSGISTLKLTPSSNSLFGILVVIGLDFGWDGVFEDGVFDGGDRFFGGRFGEDGVFDEGIGVFDGRDGEDGRVFGGGDKFFGGADGVLEPETSASSLESSPLS